MTEEIEPLEPLLVRHSEAQRILGLGASAYYKLLREKKLVAVGKGRMGRCHYPSIKSYVSGLLEARKAA